MAQSPGGTSPLTLLSSSPLSAVPSSFLEYRSRKRVQRPTDEPNNGYAPTTTRSPSSSTSRDTSGRSRSRKRRRRVPVPDDKRLIDILQRIRYYRWTLKDFLLALCAHSGHYKIRRAYGQFLDVAYTELPTQEKASSDIGNDRRSIFMDRLGWRWAANFLCNEIETLAQHPAFGEFEPPTEGNALGSLEPIQHTMAAVNTLASRWLWLIERVCHTGSAETVEIKKAGVSDGLHVIVLGMLCHRLYPRKSTNMPTALGLYLYQGGARRRVVDTLCNMGLIIGYKTIQRRLESLVSQAERSVSEVGRSFAGVTTYDNFDFQEGKRSERTGDQRCMKSITTSLVFPGRGLEDGPLRQDMWRPSIYPLTTMSIMQKLVPSGLDYEIHLHHLESAIQTLFPSRPEHHEFPWSTAIPKISRLNVVKSRYLPMKPTLKDESTTSNNIQILEDIYIQQMKIDKEDPAHAVTLRLVFGDLKTWSRIESVKSLRYDISTRPFDRFDWLLPSLGLWHLRLNMLQLIHRIHWGGSAGSKDPSTLQYAADRWARSHVVQPNDFQALEELIIHSYQARVVGIWIRLLHQNKVDTVRMTSAISWLEAQTPGEHGSWMQILRKISDQIRAPELTAKIEDQSSANDQQFENHQNFCTHVEAYLTLRYAIKYADIDLLRYALRRVMVIFQADAAGTPKYAFALLRTFHTTDSPAAARRLQEAILSNSIVNLRGQADSNFELDRLLELLNLNLKTFQRERSHFSKNSDALLQDWALNGPFLLEIKTVLETTFGRINNSQHPTKSAAEDIWGLAYNLAHRGLIQKRKEDRFSSYPTVNLFIEGLRALSGKIAKYNEQQISNKVPDDSDLQPLSTPEDEIDVDSGDVAIPDSPTLPSYPLDGLDRMFVE